MNNKKIFVVGICSLIIFIGIAAYLWYLYFNDYESKLLSQDGKYEFLRGVELINSGGIDYINATNQDDENLIPTYYFRVKNNTNKSFNYILNFENAQANDGCTAETTFSRDELEYELKLDNVVIKKGGLDTISNNVLNISTISENSVQDYALRVWLKDNAVDYANKHFHYVVNLKENK